LSRSPESLTRQLRYPFQNKKLLRQALTHRSAGRNNNERLEFLGDAVLGLVIGRTLFERFPEQDEGQLSRLRARLVKGETLAAIANEIGLGNHIILGGGELKSGGQRRKSILAGALEAIIGAVYLDAGFAPAEEFIHSLYSEKLETLEAGHVEKDPKTQLQEYLQSRRLQLPVYEIVEVKGQPHDQLFLISCRVDGIDSPVVGTGSSRRRAEQDAALKVLTLMRDSEAGQKARRRERSRRGDAGG